MPASEIETPSSEPLERRRGRSLRVEEIVLLALVLLSGIGIAVSDASRDHGYRYWLAMVPVFGVLSAIATGSAARGRGAAVAPAVAREVLHWSGLAVAVTLIYLLQATGRMTNEAAGLVALVALALTSFLAGIHGNWRFCIVGALLACAVAAAALVEEYLWVLLPLVVLVVAGALFWIRRQGASRAGA